MDEDSCSTVNTEIFSLWQQLAERSVSKGLSVESEGPATSFLCLLNESCDVGHNISAKYSCIYINIYNPYQKLSLQAKF